MTGVVAMLLGMGGLPGIGISAGWGDISFSSPTTSGTNSNVTLTFAGPTPRNIRLANGLLGAPTIEYRKNSGSYTSLPSGNTDISVASGDTLNFRATTIVDNDSGTIQVLDKDRSNILIDAFDVNITGF